MITLKYKDVTEISLHHFAAEASDLGLPTGEWPKQIPTEIGNGLPFQIKGVDRREGEVMGVRYSQLCGCCDLLIIND
jgi:hypothetical protein